MKTRSTAISLLLTIMLSSAALAQDGAAGLWKTKCQACHGADGKGDTAAGKKLGAHDLNSAEVQKMTDAQFLEVMQKGKNKMPAYEGKLKMEEMKSLVAYVRDLAKKK